MIAYRSLTGYRVPGLSTFIIVMVFLVLALLLGMVLFVLIRRSRKMNGPAQNVRGTVLEKHPTAMQEEEILLQLSGGERQRYRMMSGRVILCVGDSGVFEIRGGFITKFIPGEK